MARDSRLRPLAGALLVLCACSAELPRPAAAPQPAGAFVEVPYPPPAARAEVVPTRPRGAVWVDGQWTWDAERWAWEPGAWYAPPPGVRFVRWSIERKEDGRLFFAGPRWVDGNGHQVPPPPRPAASDADDDDP